MEASTISNVAIKRGAERRTTRPKGKRRTRRKPGSVIVRHVGAEGSAA